MKREARKIIETLGQPYRGSFFRNVALQFQESPLDAIGSYEIGGRYNKKGGFQILYAAADLDTALLETGAMLRAPDGSLISVKKKPFVTITIEVDLQNVADLTDPTVRDRLGLREDDLYVVWRDIVAKGEVPVTHRLGNIAHAAGIEALVTPSEKNRGKTNIGIIDTGTGANLLIGSTVKIHDPQGFNAGVSTTITGKKRR